MLIRATSCIVILIGLIFTVPVSSLAENTFRLDRTERTKVGRYLCGLRSKWVPVQKVGKLYRVDRSDRRAVRTCRRLLGRNRLESFSNVPSAATMAKANRVSSGALVGLAVSGTPPTLTDIAEGSIDIADLFWRAGVVDAVVNSTASTDQCLEFYGGLGTDGTSGQFSACYISQNVGFSFQTILQGGVSPCYLRNAPSQANLDGGAVTVVSGTLPDSGITGIMDAPPGTQARIVKMQVANFPGDEGSGGQDIFIRIDPAETLEEEGNHYKATLWFCEQGDDTPQGVQEIQVTLAGRITSSEISSRDGQGARSLISGYLRSSGDGIVFDTTKNRRAELVFDSGAGPKFKSEVEITEDDLIIAKSYDSFESERKAVSVAHFSGTTMTDFRYDQGAYAYSDGSRSESTVNEYREPHYVNSQDADAPGGIDLIDVRDDIDLVTDSFFQSLDTGSFDTSTESCDVTADIVIALDMAHPLMQAVQSLCEGERLDGMDFCRTNSRVSAAEFNFPNACPGVFN